MVLLREQDIYTSEVGREDPLQRKRLLLFTLEEDCRHRVGCSLGEAVTVEFPESVLQTRRLLAEKKVDGAIVDLEAEGSLDLVEEYAKRVPMIVLTKDDSDTATLRAVIELRARARVCKEEIEDLPLYLRVAMMSDDVENLWAVWLHRPVVADRVDLPFGPDPRRGAEGEFIHRLRSEQPQPQISVEQRDGVAVITHCNPPSNQYFPATIYAFYRLLRHLEKRSDVEAILFRSGLPSGYPPGAIPRVRHGLPLGLGRSGVGRFLARLMLRIRYPGIQKTKTLGIGMPLDTIGNPAMMAVTEHFGLAILMKIFCYRKPFEVLMEGLAVAGGFELSLCAHYIVATRRAMVSLPECKLAFPPPAGIPLLAERVGFQRAFALAADTRLIGAKEALRLGIIDRVVGSPCALEEAIRHARTLARSHAHQGYEYLRRSMGGHLRDELRNGFRAWRQMSHSSEALRRIQSFQRKRGA